MSGQIFELLPKVAADIGAIGKGHRNSQQNYNFRGVDDVLSVCGPAFARHSVTVSVEVIDHLVTVSERESRSGTQQVYHATLRMKVSFYAPDGSSVVNTTAGEGLDYAGDKATNKAEAAAFKYAVLLGLCVPVDSSAIEDSDRDHKPEDERKRRREPSRPAVAKTNGQQKEASPKTTNTAYANAREAIANAADMKRLDKLSVAVSSGASEGKFKAEETKSLEAMIAQRCRELANHGFAEQPADDDPNGMDAMAAEAVLLEPFCDLLTQFNRSLDRAKTLEEVEAARRGYTAGAAKVKASNEAREACMTRIIQAATQRGKELNDARKLQPT